MSSNPLPKEKILTRSFYLPTSRRKEINWSPVPGPLNSYPPPGWRSQLSSCTRWFELISSFWEEGYQLSSWIRPFELPLLGGKIYRAPELGPSSSNHCHHQQPLSFWLWPLLTVSKGLNRWSSVRKVKDQGFNRWPYNFCVVCDPSMKDINLAPEISPLNLNPPSGGKNVNPTWLDFLNSKPSSLTSHHQSIWSISFSNFFIKSKNLWN